MSIDPVTTDADTGGGFNRYAYANNSPYKYIDPDGRNPAAIPAGVGGTFVCGPVCGGIAAGTVLIGGSYAGKKIVDWWNSRSEPKRSDSEKKPSLVDEKGEKHILDGDKTGGGHRPGTGSPGKSEFPTNWSDEKILGEISDVATAPDSTHSPGKGGRTISTGTRDGVDITTVTEPGSKGGRIVTGFPTNVPRNPPAKPTSNTP
ncbi:EndoU domain-containing protein [Massilia sp. GCM10023247]|uniref:EndoU domain-containing protein n=1 Tax=Massilia sp. GCM10023247 TaxID=3252643 RepID=UPI00361370C9